MTKLIYLEHMQQFTHTARVVMYGDFSVPCGGTHVANLKDIGRLTIRKVSHKKGLIRVAYEVN